MKYKFALVLILLLAVLSGCSKSDEYTGLIQKDPNIKTRLARINIKDIGSISLRIYEEYEEDIANGFLSKAKEGFYDGTEFFSIIEDYLMIGGKNGTVSEEKYSFSGSYTKLFPFRGAICVSLDEDEKSSLDSFYIINNSSENLDELEGLIEYKGYSLNDYIKYGYSTELTNEEYKNYRENGGAPWLQGHTCVFGQVYDGFDVLDMIITKHSEDPSFKFIIENIETD